MQLAQNDSFGVMFDTYYDRRNGVFFYTTPPHKRYRIVGSDRICVSVSGADTRRQPNLTLSNP